MIETGRKCGGLPEVAPETNDTQTRIGELQSFEDGKALVRAPIVHEDQLVAFSPPTEGLGQLPIERLEVGLFVVNGYDDTQVDHVLCVRFQVPGSGLGSWLVYKAFCRCARFRKM